MAFYSCKQVDRCLRKICYNCIDRTIKIRKCSSNTAVPPLNVALPGVAATPVDGTRKEKGKNRRENNVEITTLSNGIKVASEESFGPFCTLGGTL